MKKIKTLLLTLGSIALISCGGTDIPTYQDQQQREEKRNTPTVIPSKTVVSSEHHVEITDNANNETLSSYVLNLSGNAFSVSDPVSLKTNYSDNIEVSLVVPSVRGNGHDFWIEILMQKNNESFNPVYESLKVQYVDENRSKISFNFSNFTSYISPENDDSIKFKVSYDASNGQSYQITLEIVVPPKNIAASHYTVDELPSDANIDLSSYFQKSIDGQNYDLIEIVELKNTTQRGIWVGLPRIAKGRIKTGHINHDLDYTVDEQNYTCHADYEAQKVEEVLASKLTLVPIKSNFDDYELESSSIKRELTFNIGETIYIAVYAEDFNLTSYLDNIFTLQKPEEIKVKVNCKKTCNGYSPNNFTNLYGNLSENIGTVNRNVITGFNNNYSTPSTSNSGVDWSNIIAGSLSGVTTTNNNRWSTSVSDYERPDLLDICPRCDFDISDYIYVGNAICNEPTLTGEDQVFKSGLESLPLTMEIDEQSQYMRTSFDLQKEKKNDRKIKIFEASKTLY